MKVGLDDNNKELKKVSNGQTFRIAAKSFGDTLSLRPDAAAARHVIFARRRVGVLERADRGLGRVGRKAALGRRAAEARPEASVVGQTGRDS